MVDAERLRRTWGIRVGGAPGENAGVLCCAQNERQERRGVLGDHGARGDLYLSLALLAAGRAAVLCAGVSKINGHAAGFAPLERGGTLEVKVGSQA